MATANMPRAKRVGAALGHPALQDRMARPRRSDRVDALADVEDLVDDVRAGLDEHRRGERGQERNPGETAVDRGQRSACHGRHDAHRVSERPDDLVGGGQRPPDLVEDVEVAVVVEAAGVRRGRGAGAGRSPGRGAQPGP